MQTDCMPGQSACTTRGLGAKEEREKDKMEREKKGSGRKRGGGREEKKKTGEHAHAPPDTHATPK